MNIEFGIYLVFNEEIRIMENFIVIWINRLDVYIVIRVNFKNLVEWKKRKIYIIILICRLVI